MTDNVIHCESSARHHYTILYYIYIYIYIVYNRDRTHAFFFGRFWNCFVADGFQFWTDLEGHCTYLARVTTLMWERLGLQYSLERRSSWCFWLSGWGTKELEGLVGLGGDATDVRHQQWFGRRVRGAHTGQVLVEIGKWPKIHLNTQVWKVKWVPFRSFQKLEQSLRYSFEKQASWCFW